MAETASCICEEAMVKGMHPGFSDHYLQYLTTHLYNVQACIDTHTQAPGSGLDLYYKIRDIRKANQRPGNAKDAMWLSYAEQNLGVALMAEDRAEEALPIYLTREIIQENRDLNLANIAICLYLLKRYDEAMTYCDKAIDATRELRGENSASMAT
jgi:tetratricopeptide (TPR) repeat protein